MWDDPNVRILFFSILGGFLTTLLATLVTTYVVPKWKARQNKADASKSEVAAKTDEFEYYTRRLDDFEKRLKGEEAINKELTARVFNVEQENQGMREYIVDVHKALDEELTAGQLRRLLLRVKVPRPPSTLIN